MITLAKDITALRNELEAGTVAVADLVAESYATILAHDDTLNAFITVADTAILEAEMTEAAAYKDGLLYGIPVAIKDNIMTENMKMTAASKMLSNFDKPLFNATVTNKLLTAGSINMGKVNMDEFAMGGSGETSYYGVSRNPYNLEYVAGGSSSGSATSVAAGMVKAALGTDTGGSVRQPASFTNLVGMKPTYGRVSRFGVTAFASSLDQVGVLTKTVADNARVLAAIAGHDEFDTTSSLEAVPMYHENLAINLQGKKIAVFEEYLSDEIEPEVIRVVKEAIAVYEKLGATVETVSLPHLKYVVPAYYIIAPSEASSNLARFDGIHYGYRSDKAHDLESIYLQSRAEGFGDEVKKRVVMGTYFLNHDAYDAYYIQAAKLRTLIHNDFQKVFAEYDMILGPTAPTPAFKIGERIDNAIQMYLSDLCTIPANLIGLPAMSIPGGFSSNNLPIGIQLIGPAFSEQTMYQYAYAFEQETKYYEVLPQFTEKEGA